MLFSRRQLLPPAAVIRLETRCDPAPSSLASKLLRVNGPRQPMLERLYHRYLETEDTAAFVQAVAEQYLLSTLERLAAGGGCPDSE